MNKKILVTVLCIFNACTSVLAMRPTRSFVEMSPLPSSDSEECLKVPLNFTKLDPFTNLPRLKDLEVAKIENFSLKNCGLVDITKDLEDKLIVTKSVLPLGLAQRPEMKQLTEIAYATNRKPCFSTITPHNMQIVGYECEDGKIMLEFMDLKRENSGFKCLASQIPKYITEDETGNYLVINYAGDISCKMEEIEKVCKELDMPSPAYKELLKNKIITFPKMMVSKKLPNAVIAHNPLGAVPKQLLLYIESFKAFKKKEEKEALDKNKRFRLLDKTDKTINTWFTFQ